MKKSWAIVGLSLVMAAGCTTPGKRTAIGAGAGAAGGAAAGAAIGAIAGDAGKGAWMGAAAGTVLGTMIGNRLDKQAKELAEIAETQRTENGILTRLKSELLFDTASADLRPQARQNVQQISDIIKKYPEDRLIIVGYTDNVGSDSYNQQLSERRARAVKLAMVAGGVPAASVEAMGQGESNPVAPNTSADGRQKNRRVELQITADPNKVPKG
jgi:outer membrane protein OmpA-like peptidoglycan-associated protein